MESGNIELNSEHVDVQDKKYTMPDGSVITINKSHVEFFDKLRGLPIDKLLFLFNITSQEFHEFFQKERDRITEKLIRLFSSHWMWKDDSRRYYFNDPVANDSMFGHYINKKSLMYYLRKRSFTMDELLKLETWFEEQNDLILKD